MLTIYEPSPSESGGSAAESTVTAGSSTDDRDDKIVRKLEGLSATDPDYWAFRRRSARSRAHGLTQYPAMMVPSMPAVLVSVVRDVDGRVERVLDPFAGSGTTLIECMRLGLNYAGQDINPLAVLICRTKAGPFHTDQLRCVVKDVVEQAGADRGRKVEADFPGLEKWFCTKAITELSAFGEPSGASITRGADVCSGRASPRRYASRATLAPPRSSCTFAVLASLTHER